MSDTSHTHRHSKATMEETAGKVYGTSLWESAYDEDDVEEESPARGGQGSEDEGQTIKITVPRDDKLYIRVRDDTSVGASYITHFDRRPDGTPGPVEASGAVREGDYLVAVDSDDVRGRDIRSVVGLIRGAQGEFIVLTFLRRHDRGRGRGPTNRTLQLTEQHRVVILKHILKSDEIREDRLRLLAARGIPDSEKNLRPVIWRVLLSYLPLERTQWEKHLKEQRALYGYFLKDLIRKASEAKRAQTAATSTAGDGEGGSPAEPPAPLPAAVQAEGPTTEAAESTEGASGASIDMTELAASDPILFDEVQKDVLRTHPDQQFFLDTTLGPLRLDAMLRVLFIYAKLNPGVRYVQGMNEVLGTIYFVLASDADPEWAAHAEADAFFCFTHLMGELRDLFIQKLDEAETGVEGKINHLVVLLTRHDPQLAQHFDEIKLDARYYSLRWITTLLSREFNLADTIRLWDSLFADRQRSDFVLYFCLAMLLEQREELLSNDFAHNLGLLQSYPPTDVKRLLDRMYALRVFDANSEERDQEGAGVRLKQFLRSVQSQVVQGIEDFDSLGISTIDPDALRQRLQLSEESKQRLAAAGTQLKSSVSSAAKRVWATLGTARETIGTAQAPTVVRSFSRSISERAGWVGGLVTSPTEAMTSTPGVSLSTLRVRSAPAAAGPTDETSLEANTGAVRRDSGDRTPLPLPPVYRNPADVPPPPEKELSGPLKEQASASSSTNSDTSEMLEV